METALNEANTALEALTKSPVNASSKKAIEVFKVAYSKWYNVGQGILSLKNQGDNEGALNMQQTQCEPAFAQVKASFVSLEEIIVEEQLRQAEIINLSTLTTQRISSFGVFLLVIGGISVLIFLIRFSNRTMNSITAKLDLTSSNLVSSSNQVKSASESLADNTNQQAASLEETSASLQELESTVKETSNYAMESQKLSDDVKANAELGGRELDELEKIMATITTNSQKMESISSTIEEISFQTNLLALNAAVEAARAGSAGLGFAVVAEEVRNLAIRSGNAAKEITQLLQSASSKTLEGFEKNKVVNKRFDHILSQVKTLNERIQFWETTAKEQLNGVGQISEAMNTIEGSNHGNAASAEETTGIANEVLAQSHELEEAVKDLAKFWSGKS